MNEQIDDTPARRGHGRRGALAVVAVLLVAALFGGGTYAYFTRSLAKPAEATFDFDSTKVEILNSWNPANGAGTDGQGLAKGDRVNDTVMARNTGDECYLRIRMRLGLSNSDASTSPTNMQSVPAPTETAIDNIVATLYYDSAFNVLAAGRTGGLTATDFTPTYGSYSADSSSQVANVLSTNADTYTKSYLSNNFGYVVSGKSAYATTREDARAAAATNAALKLGDFLNVTTQADYEKGLFTFEYLGDGNGRLATAQLTKPLITTVCIPYDGTLPTNTEGARLNYSISFWAESVPAAEFSDGTEDAAKRDAAMQRLEAIYPSSLYYYSAS